MGDLSGKHGRLSIRATTDNLERTLVFYDSNLPLVGPYTSKHFIKLVLLLPILLPTVLGRSVAVYSNNVTSIMACSNIEPAVLSATVLKLSFPDLPQDAMDPK